MRWIVSSMCTCLTLALVAGCPSRDVAKVDPRPSPVETKEIPVETNRKLDLLFIIDNSQSMEQEQASLVANFPRFIEVLENIQGGIPDVHIGVVSTDMGAIDGIGGCDGRGGDNGQLQSEPRGSCEGPSGAYIVDSLNEAGTGRVRNYTGSLADTFSCIAELGIAGCGFEQPLESMLRALDGNNTSNNGFLRDDAFLAIVFVTDEDDCSTRDVRMFEDQGVDDPLGPLTSFRCFEYGVDCENDPEPRREGVKRECSPEEGSEFMYGVQKYVDFIKGLKDDEGRIIVAGIMGNPGITENPEDPDLARIIPGTALVGIDDRGNPSLKPSCVAPGDEDGAVPPLRLQKFLDQFPRRNTFTTICEANLSDGLVLVAELLAKVIGNPCIEADIDMDPMAEGVQYECQVSDVINPNTDYQVETQIPTCDNPASPSRTPCWYIEEAENCASFPNSLAITIERGDNQATVGTTVFVRCVSG